MDQDLRKALAERADSQGNTAIRIGATGWFDELTLGTGEKALNYRLKPLTDLYGPGVGDGTVDPQDKRFTPLLHGIESQIVRFDMEQRGRLTDAAISLALSKLAMSPEGDTGADVLANRIQIGLRLALSLNDYSRQEVKQAIRRIARSVENHTKRAGTRGYINFARQYVKV